MADGATATLFVLRQEDEALSGVVTEDAGGITRFGIAKRWHPELADTDFYTCPAAEAQARATQIYQSQYWAPIQGDLISAQYPANRLLSFAVNMGIETALLLLQQSLNAFDARLALDGEAGPATIGALNAIYAGQGRALMIQWRNILAAHYQAIVAANPARAGELKGWLNRVKA